MVAAVFLVHFVVTLAPVGAIFPAPDFVVILLLLIPVVYAGTTFGLVGSLGTAMIGIVTLAPAELIMPHTGTGLWGAGSILAVVVVTAVMLGNRYEELSSTARALATSEAVVKDDERFRLAFDGDMAGMALANLEGQVFRVNPALCQILGRSEQELVGVSFMEYTHPEDLVLSEGINRQLAMGEVDQRRQTKRFLKKNGGLVFAEISRSLVRDEAGNPSFVITSVRDVTGERALAAQLSHQALHDPLTGLPNRTLLQDRLAMVHEREVRGGGRSALFLFDLDDFQSVNDTYGHEIGDQLLIALARRLEKVTRSPDTICRFGGDEFIYLAEGLAEETDAEKIVERLLGIFTEPFLVAGIAIDQTASMGVAMSDTAGDQDYAHLVQNADTALYRAKRQGRGGHHVLFTPSMNEQVSNRFTLTQELGHALERHELSMHYQPIVDLGTGRVVGYEALMRWHHPERGSIPPDVFIPLAEQSGLIVKLGSFALGDAIAAAASWGIVIPDLVPPYVAVNLSARQFYDTDLLEEIEEALVSSQLAPERLVLEITEGVALFDIDAAVSVIEHLKQLNVRMALDDFGTGYSSLSYLVRIGPDIIKIDQSFVNPATTDPSAERLLEAIVRLCHGLEVVALAEGIETRRQLALLTDLGCELGQGFLFSPAVPVSELPTMSDLVLRNWTDQTVIPESASENPPLT